MDALTRWLLYILTAYATVSAVLVACAFAVGWLTRGVWRRTRALIEHTLGPRGEDDSDDEDDGDLTALLDATREDDDATQEIDLSELRAAHPVYVGRRRRVEHRLSDSYINGED